MRYPVMKNCWCGISLRTGSLVIGIVWSIGCLSQTISLSIMAHMLRSCYDWDIPYQYCESGASAVLITQAVVSAVMLLANILLVVGVIKEKRILIGQWVSIYLFGLLFEVVFALMFTIFLFTFDGLIGIYALLIWSVTLGIAFYYIAVVSSYHKQLLQLQPAHGRHPQFNKFNNEECVQQSVDPDPQGQLHPEFKAQSQMADPHPQYAQQMPGQTYPPTQGQMYPHTQGQAYQQHPAQNEHLQLPKY